MILKQIGANEMPTACTMLQEKQECTPATLSHHLKELETAGLVEVTRSGKFTSCLRRRGKVSGFGRRASRSRPSPARSGPPT